MADKKQPDPGAGEISESVNEWFRQFLKHFELHLIGEGQRISSEAVSTDLKNRSSLVGTRLRNTSASDIAVCSVVRAELLHGARKYEKRAERVARVELALSPFISLPFDGAAARHYAAIRDDLESRGVTIGPNDLMIAAIAVAHGLTLVSNNREFGRVVGMRVEDWTIE